MNSKKTDQLVAHLAQYTAEIGSWRIAYGRQLLGGAFQSGRLYLASYAHMDGGMHAVTYLVAEKETGILIAFGRSESDARSMARWAISEAGSAGKLLEKVGADLKAINAKYDVEFDQLMAEARAETHGKKPAGKRGKVFDKSSGACHYCATRLDIDGNWHIEHMVPRSRGGSNHISNLVAACQPCNYMKGTKTAEEFMASVTHL